MDEVIKKVASGNKDLEATMKRFATEILEDEGKEAAFEFVMAFQNEQVRRMFL